VGCDILLHMLTQVVPQVPAVSDLRRLWRSAGRRLLGYGPVAADDLDLGPVTQPSGERFGFSAWEKMQRPVAFGVEEHSAVAMPTTEHEVIDPPMVTVEAAGSGNAITSASSVTRLTTA